ncbi:MAG: hypothetical protein K8R53_08280, partial [Bacteroidales bacterium]|nr:hypothetical protein [Bacteroidales bacterium]
TKTGTVIQSPVVVINPTDGKWKRIYVNFTPLVADNGSAIHFNVYMRMDKLSETDQPYLKIDNLKLVNKP